MPTKSELTHYRLQAMLREHNFSDLEYLGDFPDQGHTYRIGTPIHKASNEVVTPL